MSLAPTKHPLHQIAFQDLHEQYDQRLVSSLVGVVRDRDHAEDIAATAFKIASDKREQFRGESSLYTWLYAIASNEARRRTTRRQPFESLDRPLGTQFADGTDLHTARS